MFSLTHVKIFDKIKADNPLITKDMSKYFVSDPIDNDGRFPSLTGGKLIRLTPKSTDVQSGTVVIAFDAFDLQVVGRQVQGKLPIPLEINTIYEAVPYFAKEFGIVLNTEDIIDGAIDRASGTLTFKAAARSIALTGECILNIALGPSSIDGVLTALELPTFDFYTDYAMTAEFYSSHLDFTRHTAALSQFSASSDPSELIPYLISITSDIWTTDANSPFSLLGASIQVATGDVMNNKLRVQLSANCTNLTGSLVLNFNNTYSPLNPGAV